MDIKINSYNTVFIDDENIAYTDKGNIYLYNIVKKEIIKILEGHNYERCSRSIYSLTISSNKNYLYSGGYDRTIRMWDINQDSINYGKTIKILNSHRKTIYYLITSKDNNILYSASWDETIIIWNIDQNSKNFGEPIKILTGHNDSVYSLAISNDNNKLYSGSRDNTIIIWNVDQKSENFGEIIKILNNHDDWVICLTTNIINNVEYLYSGSNTTIIIWDVISNKIIKELKYDYHESDSRNRFTEIYYNKISHFVVNKNQLYCGSCDGTIRIWNINPNSNEFGEIIQVLQIHTHNINNLTLFGNNLLSNTDNDMNIYDISNIIDIDDLFGDIKHAT